MVVEPSTIDLFVFLREHTPTSTCAPEIHNRAVGERAHEDLRMLNRIDCYRNNYWLTSLLHNVDHGVQKGGLEAAFAHVETEYTVLVFANS